MLRAITTVHFRTDDADAAQERLGREFGGHSRVPAARGAMGYELFAVGTRRVVAGTTTARVGSTVRAATSGPTLHVPLAAAAHYRLGRKEMQAGGDVAVALAPDHEYSARIGAGAWIAMRIDSRLLAETLEARQSPRSRAWALESRELRLTPGDLAFMRGTISRLIELGNSKARGSGAAIESLEQQVAHWFADRLLEANGVRAMPRHGMRIAEDVDRWIRDRIAMPITLEQLSSVAGIGARCLQKACIARWGRSPLELVATHRLAAVRRRLSSARPGLSVTQAATECGVNHLGRFALSYRQAYGESPAETLARHGAASRDVAGRQRQGPRRHHGAAPVPTAFDETRAAALAA